MDDSVEQAQWVIESSAPRGFPAGLRWSDVSEAQIEIRRAVSRVGALGSGRAHQDRRGVVGSMRAPIGAPLRRQRAQARTQEGDGWVFPNSAGGPINHANCIKRGWMGALARAWVSPREGDAQKALRRTYITSALVCGRNLKLVAGEFGHTTSRMVVEVYDSFLDPMNWPDALERAAPPRARLRARDADREPLAGASCHPGPGVTFLPG